MSERKLLVLPVSHGRVEFATDEWVTIDGLNVARQRIVGRQPEKDEFVLLLDVQDLIDALRDGDDELADVEINGTVVSKTKKAVSVRLDDGRHVSLPTKYVNADVEDYLRSARLPRWLALDRGL